MSNQTLMKNLIILLILIIIGSTVWAQGFLNNEGIPMAPGPVTETYSVI